MSEPQALPLSSTGLVALLGSILAFRVEFENPHVLLGPFDVGLAWCFPFADSLEFDGIFNNADDFKAEYFIALLLMLFDDQLDSVLVSKDVSLSLYSGMGNLSDLSSDMFNNSITIFGLLGAHLIVGSISVDPDVHLPLLDSSFSLSFLRLSLALSSLSSFTNYCKAYKIHRVSHDVTCMT